MYEGVNILLGLREKHPYAYRGYSISAGVKSVMTNDREKLLMLRVGAFIIANKCMIPHGIIIEVKR